MSSCSLHTHLLKLRNGLRCVDRRSYLLWTRVQPLHLHCFALTAFELRSASTTSPPTTRVLSYPKRSSVLRSLYSPFVALAKKGAEQDVYYSSMFYVYILKSLKDNSRYVGSTENLKQRLAVHNSGSTTYSKTKRPFVIAWYCAFKEKTKALAFEKYLKQGSGHAFTSKHLL